MIRAVQALALLTALFWMPASLLSQARAVDTRLLEYWMDPSTGLMWAAKDNGRDVNWRRALKYCLDLRVAGYADWRLPTIGELRSIYDPLAKGRARSPSYAMKGDLLLTGQATWSATRRLDADGRPNGFALFFDFINEREDSEEQYFRAGKRALCVRGDVQR